ncbi:MAG: hypothetical protein GF383_05470 [Candidatus Lokiarchaeota archaeon]|nr:hypothetical protein [Candidatus Lokiarchaeota archaeon]
MTVLVVRLAVQGNSSFLSCFGTAQSMIEHNAVMHPERSEGRAIGEESRKAPIEKYK